MKYGKEHGQQNTVNGAEGRAWLTRLIVENYQEGQHWSMTGGADRGTWSIGMTAEHGQQSNDKVWWARG